MSERSGRRSFVGGVVKGVASLAVLGAAGGASAAASGAGAAGSLAALPWPYAPLDPDATAERAFASYAKGHCMYGSFEAIVGQVAERLGPPYTTFPFAMVTYGAGGVQGWGTLCGALNGAAAAFQLLSPEPAKLTDALFAWYEREALPDFAPRAAKFPNVKVAAGSPLCHASVSAWCHASGKKAYSAERKERCGALAASVARKAVLLLGDPRAIAVPLSERATSCGVCHEKDGPLENTRAKMDCRGCHQLVRDHGTSRAAR
jgi:hypothetical protein